MYSKKIIIIITYVLLLSFCNWAPDLPDWTSASHGSDVTPDYKIVFPQNSVNRMDIIIDPDNWDKMVVDMTAKYGKFGSRGPQINPIFREDPVFVPCSLIFNGKEWYQVGIRFKGNSSLFTAWKTGIWKLAFKLDFDEFEEQYPEIKDQRFYGFKQIALANNFHDVSFLREKIVPGIFRSIGVKAPYTAYYKLFIDHGHGPVYFGLYTAVEVVDDTMLQTQFGSDYGNCYKPEHEGATFDSGKFNERDFEKKTNVKEADFDDIIELFEKLHSSDRNFDRDRWMNNLESIFNVDIFLKWIAVNTVIQNWDTYGQMSHNYYLYNDPNNGQITWIPWDNNESLNRTRNSRETLTLSLNEVGPKWPLIRFLINVPEYREKYMKNVEQIINKTFNPSTMVPEYLELHKLIEPYVTGPEGENRTHSFLLDPELFYTELQYLIDHVNQRYNESLDFVNENL